MAKVAATTATAYTDRSLTPGTTYYYAVEQFQSVNISPMSAVVSVVTLALPAPPSSLAAKPLSTKEITLNWTAGPSGLPVASYLILRGTSPTGLTQLALATATAFNDYPPMPGTTYYYAVEEKNSIGNISPMSAVASAATLALPTTPTNLAATPISTSQIGLTWSAGPSGMPLVGYYIFRGTTPSNLIKVGAATAPTYADHSLTSGTTYYYAVEELDQIGNVSSLSGVVSVATLTPR